MKLILILPVAGALALACSTKDGNAGDDAADPEAATDDGTSTGAVPEVEDTGGGETTVSDATVVGSEDTGSDEGMSFIADPDGGGPVNECNQWSQDCPEGEKCVAWANDGGNSWNSTRCSPVSDSPGQTGDECTVEGSGVAGLDSCEVGNMCYYVDPETNIGSCVSLCFGSPEAPLCDPGFACSISNNGVLTLCRAECDPLLQDCDNASCLPASGTDTFVCIVDASGEGGATGDACEFLNACSPGNLCLGAEDFGPGCDKASASCCSEFCDITEADPDAACTATGHTCLPYAEEGEAPPSVQHVGFCGLAQ